MPHPAIEIDGRIIGVISLNAFLDRNLDELSRADY